MRFVFSGFTCCHNFEKVNTTNYFINFELVFQILQFTILLVCVVHMALEWATRYFCKQLGNIKTSSHIFNFFISTFVNPFRISYLVQTRKNSYIIVSSRVSAPPRNIDLTSLASPPPLYKQPPSKFWRTWLPPEMYHSPEKQRLIFIERKDFIWNDEIKTHLNVEIRIYSYKI